MVEKNTIGKEITFDVVAIDSKVAIVIDTVIADLSQDRIDFIFAVCNRQITSTDDSKTSIQIPVFTGEDQWHPPAIEIDLIPFRMADSRRSEVLVMSPGISLHVVGFDSLIEGIAVNRTELDISSDGSQ